MDEKVKYIIDLVDVGQDLKRLHLDGELEVLKTDLQLDDLFKGVKYSETVEKLLPNTTFSFINGKGEYKELKYEIIKVRTLYG